MILFSIRLYWLLHVWKTAKTNRITFIFSIFCLIAERNVILFVYIFNFYRLIITWIFVTKFVQFVFMCSKIMLLIKNNFCQVAKVWVSLFSDDLITKSPIPLIRKERAYFMWARRFLRIMRYCWVLNVVRRNYDLFKWIKSFVFHSFCICFLLRFSEFFFKFQPFLLFNLLMVLI